MGNHKGYLLILVAFMCVLRSTQSSGPTVTEPPSDKVVKLGENAHFSCQITGDLKGVTVAWRSTVRGKNGSQLLHFFDAESSTERIDKNKFTFNKDGPGKTEMTIKNVGWADAGQYSCLPLESPDKAKSARLMVIASPQISTSTPLQHGQLATLTCKVTYSGGHDFVEAGLKPNIIAKIGDFPITGNTSDLQSSGPFNSTLVFEHTRLMNTFLNGQNFTCTAKVKSTADKFELSASRRLLFSFPVTNVQVYPVKKYFYPGELVNCTAEGFPTPTFTWFPRHEEASGDVKGPLLNITEHMMGSNTWQCQAWNMVDGIPRYLMSEYIHFTVLSSNEPPPDATVCYGEVTRVTAIIGDQSVPIHLLELEDQTVDVSDCRIIKITKGRDNQTAPSLPLLAMAESTGPSSDPFIPILITEVTLILLIMVTVSVGAVFMYRQFKDFIEETIRRQLLEGDFRRMAR